MNKSEFLLEYAHLAFILHVTATDHPTERFTECSHQECVHSREIIRELQEAVNKNEAN